MNSYAFLFPGQGAQYVGMGKTFYDTFRECKHVFQEADDLLKINLSKIIFEGPEATLVETKNAQPAIYVVSYAIFTVLKERFGLSSPLCVAGLSLGEYTALTCAGGLVFHDGLTLVSARGLIMHEVCERVPGGMVVILGLSDDAVRSIVEDIHDDVWCANFNCPGQVVVSGAFRCLNVIKEKALSAGARRVLPLEVHGAFHSGLMKGAQEVLEPILRTTMLSQPQAKVAMNVTGQFCRSIEEIRELLIRQVTSSVLWHQCIHACQELPISRFIEIGCGKTLSGMNKRIGVSIPTISIETVADLDLLEGINTT